MSEQERKAKIAAEAERERKRHVADAAAAEKKRQQSLEAAAAAAKKVLDNTPKNKGDKGGAFGEAAVNAGRAYAAMGLPGPGLFDYRESPAVKYRHKEGSKSRKGCRRSKDGHARNSKGRFCKLRKAKRSARK